MRLVAFLPIKPMGKARPRFGKGRTFMPPKYMKWKRDFILALRLASGSRDPVVTPFSLTVNITRRSGKMRSDLDNSVGSILDALQDGSFIVNDRDCHELHVRLKRGKQEGIYLELEEI